MFGCTTTVSGVSALCIECKFSSLHWKVRNALLLLLPDTVPRLEGSWFDAGSESSSAKMIRVKVSLRNKYFGCSGENSRWPLITVSVRSRCSSTLFGPSKIDLLFE